MVPDGLIKQDEEETRHKSEEEEEDVVSHEEAEAASWLLPNPTATKLMETPDLNCPDQYFFSDVDPYIDLDYTLNAAGRFHHQNGSGNDSVVPVQPEPHNHHHQPALFNTEIDFYGRSKPSYSYNTPSLSHSVSSSSMDVGVVPDGNSNSNSNNAIADISNPYVMEFNGNTATTTTGVVNQPAQPACQLTGMDREARVMRYREKRKNRKFEKTIRYASRKAYAETRPRIKGRFAKRTELEVEVDRLYSSATHLMTTDAYGIVPSF